MSTYIIKAPASTDIYTLSLHDALPICGPRRGLRQLALRHAHRMPARLPPRHRGAPHEPLDALRHGGVRSSRSEEHTSELQSHVNLVCRLLLEKKKYNITPTPPHPSYHY